MKGFYSYLPVLLILPLLLSVQGARAQNLDELCLRYPQNSSCDQHRIGSAGGEKAKKLGKGEAVSERQQDQFTAQVLIPAPKEEVWEVLTDYNRFSEFLPGVAQNRATLIKDEGGQRTLLMESTNVTKVLLSQIESQVQLQLQERPTSEIAFMLVEAKDLKQFEGQWQLETVIPPDTELFADAETATLVTYRAEAIVSGGPQTIFAQIFEDQIRKNLAAIQAETIRRVLG
jgi:ribosome-associated toxin RatA of RatAB toxin-antitoxin module